MTTQSPREALEQIIALDQQAWWGKPAHDGPCAALARQALGALSYPEPVARGDEAWRPIETAPRDSTTILIGTYTEIYGFVRGIGRWESHAGISGWVARAISDPPGVLGLADPSYWMPLPSPPRAALADGGENG